MREHPVLKLLHAAAELDKLGAQARIVRLPDSCAISSQRAQMGRQS